MQERNGGLFETIYNLAKDGDIDTLKKYLNDGVCLDMMDATTMFTPAMLLASEGHKEAATLLVNLGVNINKVAKGFAINGDEEEVKLYFFDFGASADEIGSGFAMGNYHKQAQHYITYHHANPNEVAEGYAYTNNKEYLQKYLALYKTKINTNEIGMVAASAGHRVEANHFLTPAEPNPHLVIIGQAIANNEAEISAYLIQPDHNATNIGYAHALAGRRHLAKQYRTPENAFEIAKGFAASGHNADAEEYRIKYRANATDIAKMYAFMQHLPEVILYCTQYGVDLNELIPFLSGAFINDKIALRHLAFVDDEQFRNQLIIALHTTHLKSVDENDQTVRPLLDYDIISLKDQAKKINQLMRNEKMNYAEAVAWEKAEIKALLSLMDDLFIDDIIPIMTSYLLPLTDQESFKLLDKVQKQKPINKVVAKPMPPQQSFKATSVFKGRHELLSKRQGFKTTTTEAIVSEPVQPTKKPSSFPPIVKTDLLKASESTLFKKSTSYRKSNPLLRVTNEGEKKRWK